MAESGDAEVLAQKSADALWAQDKASQGLGIVIEAVGPGRSRLSMPVAGWMVNGHDICHGGYIFMLADTAFAYACNSYGARAVAQSGQIAFVSPARSGMTLIAEAEERFKAERSGIYDVTVRISSGKVIAEFRGHSRQIAGTLVPSLDGSEPAA